MTVSMDGGEKFMKSSAKDLLSSEPKTVETILLDNGVGKRGCRA